MEEFEVMPHY